MDSPASYRISVPGSTQVPDRSQSVFAYGTVTLFGRLSHTVPLTDCFVTPMCQALQPQSGKPDWFGLLPFRSPLLGESFLFLWVLRCFSSPGSLPRAMCSPVDTWACPHVGFPIRTSLARAGAHPSPELFAVYHVLHRHLAPRHPPYALGSLSKLGDTEKLMFSRFPIFLICNC